MGHGLMPHVSFRSEVHLSRGSRGVCSAEAASAATTACEIAARWCAYKLHGDTADSPWCVGSCVPGARAALPISCSSECRSAVGATFIIRSGRAASPRLAPGRTTEREWCVREVTTQRLGPHGHGGGVDAVSLLGESQRTLTQHSSCHVEAAKWSAKQGAPKTPQYTILCATAR